MSMFDNCTGHGDDLVTYLEALAVPLQGIQHAATLLEQAIADFRGNVPGEVGTCQRVEGQLEELQQALEAYAVLLTGKGKEPLPIVLLYLKYPLLTPLRCAEEAIERMLRHLAVYASRCTQMAVSVLEQRNAIDKQLQEIQKELSELLEHQRLALSINHLNAKPEKKLPFREQNC